jgi:peptidoglycan/LPS O-acetylase OafA/YrhL
MSGFILCQTGGYWRESWRSLAIQRFARLYPVHAFGVVVLAPFLFLGADRWPTVDAAREVAWNLVGLQALRWDQQPGIQLELNGPAWSVTPLLFGGMALPVLRRLGMRDWRVTALLGVLGALCLGRIAVTFAAPGIRDAVDLMARHTSPVPHMVEILCGGICYLLMTKAPEGLQRWLGRDSTMALAAGLIAIPLWVATGNGGEAGAYYFVHGPAFPAVLLFVCAAYYNAGVMDAVSRARWVKMGGEMSILIFLLHMPVWRVMYRVGQRIGIPQAALESGPAIGLGMVAIVAAAYLGLRPAEVSRRWVTGVLEGWTGARKATPMRTVLAGESGLVGDLVRMGGELGYSEPERPKAEEARPLVRKKSAGA